MRVAQLMLLLKKPRMLEACNSTTGVTLAT
jgi:hypothetical protein